jgi:hypothetical protein
MHHALHMQSANILIRMLNTKREGESFFMRAPDP